MCTTEPSIMPISLYLPLKLKSYFNNAGWKENHFYSLPFAQAEASIYQPRRHFNQPQKLLTSRIDVTVLLLFEFLKKHYLPVGQVKNRIHQQIRLAPGYRTLLSLHADNNDNNNNNNNNNTYYCFPVKINASCLLI